VAKTRSLHHDVFDLTFLSLCICINIVKNSPNLEHCWKSGFLMTTKKFTKLCRLGEVFYISSMLNYIFMSKYMLGEYHHYTGAVLKRGETGVIQSITYQKGGDWVIYADEKGELKQFPLWNHFGDKSKRSLGQLVAEEFDALVLKLTFLPREELWECYQTLKGFYNARQT
jgi:hypothetical protein